MRIHLVWGFVFAILTDSSPLADHRAHGESSEQTGSASFASARYRANRRRQSRTRLLALLEVKPSSEEHRENTYSVLHAALQGVHGAVTTDYVTLDATTEDHVPALAGLPTGASLSLLAKIAEHVDSYRWQAVLFGIVIGIAAYATTMCVCGGKRPTKGEADLECLDHNGFVNVRNVYFGGALFRQFSWCPAADYGRELRILDVRGRPVAALAGSLIPASQEDAASAEDAATPAEPEILEAQLRVGTKVWATLRRNMATQKLNTRRPSFHIHNADGALYVEVRVHSETKCIVQGPPPLRRRVITVVGNFAHNDFLNGDRNIHVWSAQAGTERTLVGAQVETRVESVRTSGGATRRAQSYFVSTAEHVDTPLIMAVVLGLQEIHAHAPPRRREKEAVAPPPQPDEGGSAPTIT